LILVSIKQNDQEANKDLLALQKSKWTESGINIPEKERRKWKLVVTFYRNLKCIILKAPETFAKTIR